LLNRHEFDVLLRRVHSTAVESGGEHSLLIINIANFKVVNDTAGHASGDVILKQAGAVLLNHARRRDVVARLSGDEFGVIMEHCNVADAVRVANEITGAIRHFEFAAEGHRFKLDSYASLIPINARSGSLETFMRATDVATFIARDRGPGTIYRYDADEASAAQKQTERHWVGMIRSALEEGRINLFAEPIVRRNGTQPAAYELLLRVFQDGHLLDTGTLVGAAERYGIARQLDLYVISEALQTLSANVRWLAGLEFVSINISAQSLGGEGFIDALEKQILDSQVPPKKLCFEITETAAIANIEAAVGVVRRLRDIGCRVALDDFGSGLSSFHYLKRLPCDLIKIDGEFVREVTTNESDRALVEAIHGIASLLGVQTVAEYVENEAIDAIVRKMGISYRQGHCFGKAKPLIEVMQNT
jgi:diguanylate cyclase (GGDEF)-like protein